MSRKSRIATPGKKRNRWLTTAFVTAMMLFSFCNLSQLGLANLHRAVDTSGAPGQEQSGTGRSVMFRDMPVAPFSRALDRGLTLELALLLAGGLMLAIGAKELAQPDWDLEWLTVLPVPTSTLLWSRVIERSVVNPPGLLTIFPTCLVIAWYSGWGWWTLVAASGGALCLLLLNGLGRTIADTGLRLSLSSGALRNVQATAAAVGLLPVYVAMSMAMQRPSGFVFGWARAFPEWALWTPPGLVVQVLSASSYTALFATGSLLLLQLAILLVAGVNLLQVLLRNGVVTTGERETGRQSYRERARPAFSLGSAVQRRELRLLSRDRNFLVQTLLLPIIVVVSQLLLNGQLSSVSSSGWSPAFVACTAFVIAGYSLMFSAFQTISSEGGALWLLYTVPKSLEDILKQKAQLWALLALVYPITVIAVGIHFAKTVETDLISYAVIAIAGVPIFSLIAVSLGVFGSDPFSTDPQTRLRPTYVYLYMLLVALYTYSILAPEWWQKIVFVVLSALLALALWQKARDELPYLLDPAASPPALISTSDGLIAAMMFFVFQGVATVLMSAADQQPTGVMVVAFLFAGALTYGLIRYTYWRAKTQGVPTVLGRAPNAVGWGLGAGAISALLGISYVIALPHLGPLSELANESRRTNLPGSAIWVFVLAVFAAPVFEEFIFRGLIFGGLRRSVGAWPAVFASSAIFAIVHPPVAMLPVFALGVCAAVAYDRSKALLAPMLTHATYNAVVVGYQLIS